MRILIAEHNKPMLHLLQHLLADAEYTFECVSDGAQALKKALKTAYDMIILAVNLPAQDAISVTRELRRFHVQTPVLMLAEQASPADKVMGLDSGADDYMTKPFDHDELLARVRALIRRGTPNAPAELQFGDLTYHSGNASVTCGDREIRLNYKESEILKLLISFPQYILSKEELISKVWGYNAPTSDNNVEAYISFLRKKLLTVESNVTIIAIKKQGYKLEYRG